MWQKINRKNPTEFKSVTSYLKSKKISYIIQMGYGNKIQRWAKITLFYKTSTDETYRQFYWFNYDSLT